MRKKQMLRRAIFLLTLSAMPCFADAQGSLLVRSAPAPAATSREAQPREDVARFAARVEETLSGGAAGKADWGVLVTDAGTGEVLYARNANRYFLPASNAKLFTTAMALSALGPDFRIRTTIETPASVDRAGRLNGDLILVGRGDPNLSNRILPFSKKDEREGPLEKILAQMAEQVVARGVKQIDGDIIADDSDFVLARFPSGWTVDDTVWSYGAAVSPIAVNDNTMTLEVRPGPHAESPLLVDLQPATNLYEIRNDGVTTSVGTEPQLRLERDPESRVFRISGTLPLGAAPRPLMVAVTEPAESAAALLLRLLQDRGVRVRGRARARHAGDLEAKPQPGDERRKRACRAYLPPAPRRRPPHQ